MWLGRLLVLLLLANATPLSADPTVGSWSAPIDVGVVGIDAILLHTGKVLLFGHPDGDSHDSSRAHLLDPQTGAITDVTFKQQPPINFFCSGHSQLSNGEVLITGGQLYGQTAGKGIPQATIFDPIYNSWKRLPPMARARWYPTNTLLPDGTTLVATGLDADGVTLVEQMELYDPVANTFTTLPASADTSTDLYAQMSLLPSGNVFRSEPNVNGELYDPATKTWTFVDTMNYGPRYYAGSVLLPGLTRVLVSGGIKEAFRGDVATNTAEIIELSAASPQWQYSGSLNTARWQHNLVLLPDESVLAVGGGRGPDLYDNPVFTAELYNPATEQWTAMASQAVQRTYHSTALLLPDGRVLSAGSDWGTQSQTVEYYRPPYLFKGPRPTMTGSPAVFYYGETRSLSTPDAASIGRVSLMRLGSTTHTNDFDQRLVRLPFVKQSGSVMVTIPTALEVAPPGYYMMFLVNTAGVPSVGSIVRVSDATPQSEAVGDVDGSGGAEALSDGVLVLRFLLGFGGESLTAGAVDSDCHRCSSSEVESYLAAISEQLDVDGNGTTTALTDGLLIIRYLFGFRGEVLVDGAVASNCTQCTAGKVEDQIQGLLE